MNSFGQESYNEGPFADGKKSTDQTLVSDVTILIYIRFEYMYIYTVLDFFGCIINSLHEERTVHCNKYLKLRSIHGNKCYDCL